MPSKTTEGPSPARPLLNRLGSEWREWIGGDGLARPTLHLRLEATLTRQGPVQPAGCTALAAPS